MTEDFYVYRPKLALRLSSAGVTLERIQNIYNNSRPAWKCTLTRKAAYIIADYFVSIDKDIPQSVKEKLNIVISC